MDPVGVATITPSAAYEVKNEPLIATSRRARRPGCGFSSTASFNAHQRPLAGPFDSMVTCSIIRSATA